MGLTCQSVAGLFFCVTVCYWYTCRTNNSKRGTDVPVGECVIRQNGTLGVVLMRVRG